MNKQLVSVAAVAAMAAGGALAVESQNVVGFIEKELEGEEWLLNLGACFSNVGIQDGGYVVSNKIFETEVGADDKIYIMDGDAWDISIYEYRGTGKGWAVTPAGGDSYNALSFEVPAGAHVYYEPVDDPSVPVKIAGEVAPSGTVVVSFDISDGDWFFELVNPFPKATTLGEIASFLEADDKIYQFDGDAWDISIYEYRGAGKGWAVTPAGGDSYNISDADARDLVFLEAGEGAYLEVMDSREWTVTLNY